MALKVPGKAGIAAADALVSPANSFGLLDRESEAGQDQTATSPREARQAIQAVWVPAVV